MTENLILQTLPPATHYLGGFRSTERSHRERTTSGPFIFFDQRARVIFPPRAASGGGGTSGRNPHITSRQSPTCSSAR